MHAREVFRRLVFLGAGLCVLIAAGAVAYSLTEQRSLWAGFVWAVDTIATTGSIPAPEDEAGQIVKVVLTFLGVGTLFYVLIALTELVVSGELGGILSERRGGGPNRAPGGHHHLCGGRGGG